MGEIWLLTQTPRAATATATTRVEVAVIPHRDMVELIRRRPDIGVIIYRSLALGLGHQTPSGRRLVRSTAGQVGASLTVSAIAARAAVDAGRMIASVEPVDA